jgi:DNA-binding HxlR family transcriptional regulator
MSDKWATVVIVALARGTMRFGELRRQLDGVSQKVLTATLRSMERNGLVTRTVYPVVPPRVDYALTGLGLSLFETLGAICKWGADHMDDVDAARERWDREAVTISQQPALATSSR